MRASEHNAKPNKTKEKEKKNETKHKRKRTSRYTHTHTHQTHQNKTAISNQHFVYQLNCPMHFISDADHLINR